MTKMKQLVKLEGFGNVQMLEADIPQPDPDGVVVEVKRSLISRGSELFKRYVAEEALPPSMMGYSDAGDVVAAGPDVDGYSIGQRVMVMGPHAQYASGAGTGDNRPRVSALPSEIDYDAATFLPLAAGGVAWSRATPIEPGDTVVVQGQGLVGNLYSQAVRQREPGRVITTDAYDFRLDISSRCGADETINVSKVDSVEAVMDLTGGEGADVVVECVGGFAGGQVIRADDADDQAGRRRAPDRPVPRTAPATGQRPDDEQADDRRILEVARRAERDGHAGHGGYADGRAYHRRPADHAQVSVGADA